jgi:hypothetical protein
MQEKINATETTRLLPAAQEDRMSRSTEDHLESGPDERISEDTTVCQCFCSECGR